MKSSVSGATRLERMSPHRAVAVAVMAPIVFLAPFEPNFTLRYGPFIALFGVLISGPLGYRIGWTEWSLALFALWVGLGTFWTGFPEAYSTNMLAVMSVAVIFVGIRAATRDGAGVRVLIAAYVVGSAVGLLRTSSQFATPEAVRDTLNRVTQVGDLNVNYVAYATVAAVLMLLLLLTSGGVRKRLWKIGVIVVIVTLCAGIAATQTRGALLAIILLGLWLLGSRFGQPIKTVVVTSFVVAFAITAGWADGALNLIDVGARAVFGLSGRTELWELARTIWGQHFLMGAGFGAVRAVTTYSLPAHNTFLELSATLGLIGALLYFTTVVSAMRDRLDNLPARDRAFRIGALVVTFLPAALSATWELSAAAWVAFAILSQPATLRDALVPSDVKVTLDVPPSRGRAVRPSVERHSISA